MKALAINSDVVREKTNKQNKTFKHLVLKVAVISRVQLHLGLLTVIKL